MSVRNVLAFTAIAVMTVSLTACNRSSDSTTTTAPSATQVADEGHTHGEWWCSEHGVPEEQCAQCNTTLVADFKAKGDWCDEHNRPDSQCFICHPEKQAEFAALYEAKYGHQPPELGAAGSEHDHDHDG
jgi:cobalt-zinc-cadmium efflux system membrane fusion protein